MRKFILGVLLVVGVIVGPSASAQYGYGGGVTVIVTPVYPTPVYPVYPTYRAPSEV